MKKLSIIVVIVSMSILNVFADDVKTLQIEGFDILYEKIQQNENNKVYKNALIILPEGASPSMWECEIIEKDNGFEILTESNKRQVYTLGNRVFVLEKPKFIENGIVCNSRTSYPYLMGRNTATFQRFYILPNNQCFAEFEETNNTDKNRIKIGGWLIDVKNAKYTEEGFSIIDSILKIPETMGGENITLKNYYFDSNGNITELGVASVPSEILSVNGFIIKPENIIINHNGIIINGMIEIDESLLKEQNGLYCEKILLDSDGFIEATYHGEIILNLNGLSVETSNIDFKRSGILIDDAMTKIDGNIYKISNLKLYPNGDIKDSGEHDYLINEYFE